MTTSADIKSKLSGYFPRVGQTVGFPAGRPPCGVIILVGHPPKTGVVVGCAGSGQQQSSPKDSYPFTFSPLLGRAFNGILMFVMIQCLAGRERAA